MPKPERQFEVGESVKLILHTGRIVDGVVKAIVREKDATRLQVDYETDQTALVDMWRVYPK